MPHYLLRYQAASFDDNAFDTTQLSGIRGASLSYLYSGELVERTLRGLKLKKFDPIFTGASQGAFTFEAEKSDDAIAVKNAVEQALKTDDTKPARESDNRPTGCHNHLAYVVALVEGNNGKALLEAESLCNVKKLQHGSFRLPAFAEGAVKPGGRRDPRPVLPREDRSAAMKARQGFGRDQRQKFYERMSCKEVEFSFTDELQEIVDDLSWDPDAKLPVSLENKIAVFYADGDKFGARFKALASNDFEAYGKASTVLKDDQKQLLRDILDWLGQHYKEGQSNPYFNNGYARFETLMWGGEEVLFVMPSWLGLDFAWQFYEWTRGWRPDGGDKDWTYSFGLVFCDRKTPIRQIKDVAKELAERNKALGDGAIQIEVFESLSMPDVDFDAYRRNLYFPDRKPEPGELEEVNQQLSIPGHRIGDLIKRIADLKDDNGLPRSQLYRLLQKASATGAAASRRGGDQEVRADFERWKRRAGSAAEFVERNVDVLRDIREWEKLEPRTKVPAFSLSLGMVAMLWDYVNPLEGIYPGGKRHDG